MIWSTLIAGFVLGAAGSLHCIGMCGPLSLALPTYHLSKGGKFISLLTYQFGRIITYSLFGLLFGLAGRTIFIAGFQRGFSIIAGAVILTAACLYFIQKHTSRFSFFTGFYSSVQKTAAKILRTGKGLSGFLLLGMINGLLPCGMVYIAIAS
ncbi:MAG: sulfite exporter TauE/SafE family protein, partial [Bacteroidota bacterium]